MLTTRQYDALERAITAGTRVAIRHRGAEWVVVPERLRTTGGVEAIVTSNPVTGLPLVIPVDEVTDLDVVR
jgi:hypothetical protein